MNLLHYVHHKYTGKYPWLRVGNCKELFSLGDTCQQAWFNSSTGFALDRLRHILNISQMPSISIEEAGFPTLLVCGTPQPEEQEQPRERRQSETDASRTLQRQQAGNFATNTWKAWREPKNQQKLVAWSSTRSILFNACCPFFLLCRARCTLQSLIASKHLLHCITSTFSSSSCRRIYEAMSKLSREQYYETQPISYF